LKEVKPQTLLNTSLGDFLNMNYTNAQFRNILNGLGHRRHLSTDDFRFPVTNDNSPLTDTVTIEGIKRFQSEYQLVIDGIVGSITMAKAEQVMKIIQDELNQFVGAGIPKNKPFYGPQTCAAVKIFQGQIGWWQDGVATYQVRKKLYEFAQNVCRS
jgi:murein L,D-transpeptidase YcbB/YkuD